jgi:HD-GYP domain-containing protein (c-di-GMP phosphodiesterase class II)
MLHDMVKLQLPEELRRHHGLDMPADPLQLAQWQEHARLGYELIHNQVEASAASAVLHHHQHFDGSGFPARVHHDGTRTQMSGQRIHVFARILHLADLYDRLSTGRRGRKRRSTLQVLHHLRTRYASWVDPVILKVLEAVCPAFPPGNRVGLSDGASAIVTALNVGKPFTPVVRRLDADGWTLQEQPLDLSADGAPSIVTLNGHPVAQLVMEMTAPNRNGAASAITNPATDASGPSAAGD